MKQQHGGKRDNAGRPKLGNVLYQRRINPVLTEVMDRFLNECKNEKL